MWASPVFSPDTALRCRRSWPGKEETPIRPEACFCTLRIGLVALTQSRARHTVPHFSPSTCCGTVFSRLKLGALASPPASSQGAPRTHHGNARQKTRSSHEYAAVNAGACPHAYIMEFSDISVYDGGWFEWSGDGANPIAVGDSGAR